MSPSAKPNPKGELHPRNLHRGRYDIDALCQRLPELKQHIQQNPNGDLTINFSHSAAVIMLNKALLAHHYQIENWSIPKGFLCPPIPGRADYIHYAADLLGKSNNGKVPKGKSVKVLDIGTGANCIYPIIGNCSYGWQFVGTDVELKAVASAKENVDNNDVIKNQIEIRQQPDTSSIFNHIIQPNDRFDLTLCNPPFHKSAEAAQAGTNRKNKNLNKGKQRTDHTLNFGGQSAELWCPGGEIAFVSRMIHESVQFADQVCWFTCLISKKENINPLSNTIAKQKATQSIVIDMAQGQKNSRILAWSFLSPKQQLIWAKHYWKT